MQRNQSNRRRYNAKAPETQYKVKMYGKQCRLNVKIQYDMGGAGRLYEILFHFKHHINKKRIICGFLWDNNNYMKRIKRRAYFS